MFDSDFHARRVLITGGLGFIGANLAARLVNAGALVTLVDSLMPQYGGNLANIAGFESRVRLNISDVRDPFSLRHLVQGQEFLFNLAGQTSHLDSMADPFTDLEINARAQLSILEACRHHNPAIRIVFASTRQIYGKPDYLPVDERHLVRPVDVNGVNKAAGEAFHRLYHDVYGVRATSLRLTNTYGPRMRIKDARQTFIGIWIRLLLEGKQFEVWEGSQLRDFNFVDDVVEAMVLAARHPEGGMILNLGSTEVVSLRDLAEILVHCNDGGGYEMKSFPEDRKRIDIGDYYADYQLARNTLGWEPRTTLREGLRQTLEYYRQHLPEYL